MSPQLNSRMPPAHPTPTVHPAPATHPARRAASLIPFLVNSLTRTPPSVADPHALSRVQRGQQAANSPGPATPQTPPKKAPPSTTRHSGGPSRNPVRVPRPTSNTPKCAPPRLKSFLEKTLIAHARAVFAARPPTGIASGRVAQPRPSRTQVLPRRSASGPLAPRQRVVPGRSASYSLALWERVGERVRRSKRPESASGPLARWDVQTGHMVNRCSETW